MANDPKEGILSYSDLFTRDVQDIPESRLISKQDLPVESESSDDKASKRREKKPPAKSQSVDNALSISASSDEGRASPKEDGKTPAKAQQHAGKSRSDEQSSKPSSGKKSPPKTPNKQPVTDKISKEDESEGSEIPAPAPRKVSKTPEPAKRKSNETPTISDVELLGGESEPQATPVPPVSRVASVPRTVSLEKSATKYKPGKKAPGKPGNKPVKPLISDTEKSEESEAVVAAVEPVATEKPVETETPEATVEPLPVLAPPKDSAQPVIPTPEVVPDEQPDENTEEPSTPQVLHEPMEPPVQMHEPKKPLIVVAAAIPVEAILVAESQKSSSSKSAAVSTASSKSSGTVHRSKSVLAVKDKHGHHHRRKSPEPIKAHVSPSNPPAPAPAPAPAPEPKKEPAVVAEREHIRRLWRYVYVNPPERRYHDECSPSYTGGSLSDGSDKFRTKPQKSYPLSAKGLPEPKRKSRRVGQYRIQTKWGPCHPGIAIPVIAVLTLLLRVFPCIVFGIILLRPSTKPAKFWRGFKALNASAPTKNLVVTQFGPAILFVQVVTTFPVCCLLFAAILRESPKLVLPYIVVQVIAISVWLVLSLAAVGTQLQPDDSDDSSGLILISGIGAVFDLWAMMTIMTAYMDIKGYTSPWDEESPPPEPEPEPVTKLRSRDVKRQGLIQEDTTLPKRAAPPRRWSTENQPKSYAPAEPSPSRRSPAREYEPQKYKLSPPRRPKPTTREYAPQRYIPAEVSPPQRRTRPRSTQYDAPTNYAEPFQKKRERTPHDPNVETFRRNMDAEKRSGRSMNPHGSRHRDATSPGPSRYTPRYQSANTSATPVVTRYAPPAPTSTRRVARNNN